MGWAFERKRKEIPKRKRESEDHEEVEERPTIREGLGRDDEEGTKGERRGKKAYPDNTSSLRE